MPSRMAHEKGGVQALVAKSKNRKYPFRIQEM